MARRKSSTLAFDALSVEGSLISPAILARIAAHEANGQSEADYRVPKGLTLRDEIARYFRIGQALFAELAKDSHAVRFTQELLRDVFGFTDIAKAGIRTRDGHQYSVMLEALGGRVPVVVVPSTDDLDRASDHIPGDGRRRSAASAIQDWLNANDEALWGFACNGERLRLCRDNASLTRPAYIEADLRQMFEAEGFADFAALWLLIHASRFGKAGTPAADCALERWREAGAKEGLAARDRLREGVAAALLALGSGFLVANPELRERVKSGSLPLQDYFGQLLRLIYRLIFLLVAEERGLLHVPTAGASARRLYAEGYSLSSLRERAIRRVAWDNHHDRWEGFLAVFKALHGGEKLLGLPALGGLFLPELTPALLNAKLPNRALMETVYRLAWLKDGAVLVPINWRDMETEEFGSVYESLLELTPRIADDGRSFAFAEGAETKGNARKTTGSYYTPDSLVQALLDSALDPVLDRVEREAEDPSQAFLAVTVIDPACGSGHFLLAAARRIATRLARARAGGVASAEDYRHALRDVARSCIHGVDRNPMAVELTKVALWIETVEPGRPLGFLDANIRCGDSLLGVFDLAVLDKGIPDEAYKPLTGDDKETAKYFAKRNRMEREGQGTLGFLGGTGRTAERPKFAEQMKVLRALPEDTAEEIEQKRKRFAGLAADKSLWGWRIACDLYVAAFLAPKIGGVPKNPNEVTIPTTQFIRQALSVTLQGKLVGHAQDLAGAASAFHWPLEFPDVMAKGGFDCVLGNPPWERIKLQEQEFFASRDADISEAPNASARGKLIVKLRDASEGSRERRLFEEFEQARRAAEASSVFARLSGDEGGRFPLAGRGDVNTYALFAEHFVNLAGPRGRAGIIIPTGIATADTTKYFFDAIVRAGKLVSLYSFFEIRQWFEATDDRNPFGLMTIGSGNSVPEFAFSIVEISELQDERRRFNLTPEMIALINPNTRTAPVFRSKADAELTTKLYDAAPIFLREGIGTAGNQWNSSFFSMFHMANDSELFRTSEELQGQGFMALGTLLSNGSEAYFPLFEANMIHLFDHRSSTFDGPTARTLTLVEKQNPDCEPKPRYWLPNDAVEERLFSRNWQRNWLLGFRSTGRAGDVRTLIPAILPRTAVSGKLPLILSNQCVEDIACLLANLGSIVTDYCVRQKVGGADLTMFVVKQIPILQPIYYRASERGFVVPRVLELTYTSHAIAPFARDLGYEGPPFAWDEDRRAHLRSELDAFYAKAYGLTRDELCYILDPASVKGASYPSETFRVLKTNEIRKYGEYRTQRLVLEAWDRMERAETAAISAPISITTSPTVPVDFTALPDGAWAAPAGGNVRDKTLAQIAAVLKALAGPTPVSLARRAALYALEPRLLTPHLMDELRAQWLRLVGTDAAPRAGVATLGLGGATGWGEAVRLLAATGCLVEDTAAQTWVAGTGLDQYFTDSWPRRAVFALEAATAILASQSAEPLSAEEQEGLTALAA